MSELLFQVNGARYEPYAAAPLILFEMALENRIPARPISNLMLQCQLRIEARDRHYSANEQERLSELFGSPRQWSDTLHSLLWTHISVHVPGFEQGCRFELPVNCSYDFNLSIAKYFHGLESGGIPLLLLFSGTLFYRDPQQHLQLLQISRECEARYRLPLSVWREMMDHYYPDTAWLPLSRRSFDRIYRYKRKNGLTGWDQALSHLFDAGDKEMP